MARSSATVSLDLSLVCNDTEWGAYKEVLEIQLLLLKVSRYGNLGAIDVARYQ